MMFYVTLHAVIIIGVQAQTVAALCDLLKYAGLNNGIPPFKLCGVAGGEAKMQ